MNPSDMWKHYLDGKWLISDLYQHNTETCGDAAMLRRSIKPVIPEFKNSRTTHALKCTSTVMGFSK
jgi:hypothetical protein